jgi:hypothetical protein
MESPDTALAGSASAITINDDAAFAGWRLQGQQVMQKFRTPPYPH